MSLIPPICIVGAAGLMGHGLLKRLLDPTGVAAHLHAVDAAHERLLTQWTSPNPALTIHTSIVEAIVASEVIVLAIPYQSEQHLSEAVREALAGKIVVSITNPLTATLDDVQTPSHESAAECLAVMLPDSRIVKALNTISSSALLLPYEITSNYDTFVASDDENAAQTVEHIVRAIGFRPWYVGNLKLSRTLERMTALLIGISKRYELTGPLGWNVQGAQPD